MRVCTEVFEGAGQFATGPSRKGFEAHNLERGLESWSDDNTILSLSLACSPTRGMYKEK